LSKYDLIFMDSIKIDGINYNLTDLEEDCWIRLLNGSLKGRDPLHNPVVANTNAYGINMRTIVLRKVDTAQKTLAFHTDIRSGKWNELMENHNISWLFYDAAARIQIRLSGKASLHFDDAIALEAWLKSTANSRKIYMGDSAPSEQSNIHTSGMPITFQSTDPTIEESEAGRKNFGVIITKVNWMEWLWLNSAGHRRASFTYNDDNSVLATWLVP
jgi:pyridoxamine 5'-phosphate oxidase